MILNNETEIDLSSLDPEFGDWITTKYSAIKNEEAYGHVFILHHPDEEREKYRPKNSTMLWKNEEKGAQFGVLMVGKDQIILQKNLLVKNQKF